MERIAACLIKSTVGLEQMPTALGTDAVVKLDGFFVEFDAVDDKQTANEDKDNEGETYDCFKGLRHKVYLPFIF